MSRPMRVLGVVSDPPVEGMAQWSEQIAELARTGAQRLLEAATSSAQGEDCAKNTERSSVDLLCPDVMWTFVNVFAGEALPQQPATVHGYEAVVLSGSVFNVTDAHEHPWMTALLEWLIHDVIHPDVVSCGPRIPTFAICFGHQAVATALGGCVLHNPKGSELGTCVVTPASVLPPDDQNADPLLLAVARHCRRSVRNDWRVQQIHFQSVVRLPNASVTLAGNEKDAHQFVRFCPLVYGVQFHPEYSVDFMKRLADEVDVLSHEGPARASYLEELGSTSEAPAMLLALFFALVRSGGLVLADS